MVDHLIPEFTSKDPLRPALQQANKIGEFVYATDAHVAIKIPNGLLAGVYGKHKKTPDIESIFQQADERSTQPVNLYANKLQELLLLIPQKDLYKDCPACDGEGEIACPHCGIAAECDDCSGTGDTNIIVGKTFVDSTIDIDGIYFNPRFIVKILKVEEMVNAGIIWRSKHSSRANIFQIGEIEILCMPASNDTGIVVSYYSESAVAP